MSAVTQFQINNPEIVFETIENETVIVDLSSGSYYSLIDAGSIIWTELAAGQSVPQILTRLNREYDAPPQVIETAVHELLQELVREQLLTTNPGANIPFVMDPAPDNAGEPSQSKRAFQPPHLDKFSDMQELLLLDPLHQVNETGWPHSDNNTSA